MKTDLSIIIVNYCTYNFTKQTIESVIQKNHSFNYEIIIVDNASSDNSLENLKKTYSNEINENLIKFIANKENKGFAYANNLALKQTNSKYLLLLNSDTKIIDNCLEKCLKFMDTDKNIGVLGCKVMLPDGTLDKACRRSYPDVNVSFYRMTGLSHIFPKSERFNKYNLTYLDENGIYNVDCLTGAFMLIRNEVIDQIGLLDESFFMYGEDIDYCYRVKENEWKVKYYGEAEIIHYKGASSKKQKSKLLYEFYNSMQIFYNKHYQDKYPWFITIVTYTGIWTMYGLKLIINQIKLTK
ncbi:MAG: glycosyltransferase family 2 protein [Methanobacterium sp.]